MLLSVPAPRVPFGVSATTRVYRVATTLPDATRHLGLAHQFRGQFVQGDEHECTARTSEDGARVISGSSLVVSPTNSTSTSSVRGPQWTSRVRPSLASARRRALEQLAWRGVGRELDDQVPESRPGQRRPTGSVSYTCETRCASLAGDDLQRPRPGARHGHRRSSPATGTPRRTTGVRRCSARRPWRRLRQPGVAPFAPRPSPTSISSSRARISRATR